MAENLKKEYRDLETKVLASLRDKINNSKTESRFLLTKSIPVNVFDYVELAIIYDSLTFLDAKGYQYSLFADCGLEDLIDILNK
jgi:hypothetical protein